MRLLLDKKQYKTIFWQNFKGLVVIAGIDYFTKFHECYKSNFKTMYRSISKQTNFYFFHFII